MPALSWSDVSKLLLFSHSLIHSPVWIFRIQHRSPHPALSTPDFFHLYTFIVYTSMKICLVSCQKFTTLVDINFSNEVPKRNSTWMRNSYNNSVWVSDLLLSAPGGKQHLSWSQTQRDSGRQSVNGWHDQTWHGSRLMNFNHVMSSLSWLICHVCHVSQTAGNEHVEAPMSPGAGDTKHTQDTHQGDNRTSGPSEMKSSSRRHFSSHLNMRVTTERMWTMIDIFSLYLKSIVCPRV